MADIESNIKVNIDTSDALSQLKLLQQQISAFQQAMRASGAANAQAAAQMQQNLVSSINATGKFRANIQTIKTSAESFTESLEKNKLSIGEYFRYAGGASKTFGKLFKQEFATINQVAKERVKELQTQYIKLGRDANGALKAIAVKPLALDMDSLATKTQMAAQRQQLFNQLMKQGSTQLLNFGKNTQWAGRQLMVGFTIPLTLLGTAASKAYMQIEQASIKFKRVYGDLNTTTTETNKMVKSVQALANEFTKYGVAVADTMDMAAQAAAMGKTGADLLQQIDQAAKLAVLGGVDQSQALATTISLTDAFKISTDELGKSVNFLNAVENQTALSIEDLTIAIPKAAPVVKQLGGDVKDLSFFLTAMKEGGINASEGANALKSGLASLINPSQKAADFVGKLGININGIVESNKGDIKGTVIGFAKALDTLDPLNRARAIEQMFGKFQFSRLSTLFQNVIAEGSQAQTVASLANQTTEELAILSERELKRVSDSPMFKFQKSIQDMQAKLAPVGEAFLKAVTPIVEFVSKILDGFNNLSDGAKNFITILVTVVGGIGPVLLMTFGLIANGVANIMKLFTNLKGFINKTTKPSDILGEQTEYMNTEQLRAAAIAASLDQAHSKLRQTFTSEAAAVQALTKAYRDAVAAQGAFAGTPGVSTGGMTPNKYANGVSMVPGPAGAGDIVPALLSPGEAVIPARSAKKYAPVIRGMISGNLPGFEKGTAGAGMRQSLIGPLNEKQTEGLVRTGKTMKEISDEVAAGPYGQTPPTNYGTQISPTTGHSFPAFGVGGVYEKPDGNKVFVKPQMDLVSAMAEIRGTTIARDAHGLISPEQALRVMMDPTDPDNKRKFLVLESALDARLADAPKTFTKDQYFKQLVASLLRGDKDLGVGNLGGDVLADVGTAGVFQTASGKRQLGGKINSMEEQAIINLLGVKGGAKKFFAESTANIAKSMSPAEYDAAMKAEIQAVAPRLQATIAGFGNLSPEEKKAYMDMQQRLQAGMSVDWAKYQVMHSGVKPREYNLGTPTVEKEDYAKMSPSNRQSAYERNIRSVQDAEIDEYIGLQDTHIVSAISDPNSAGGRVIPSQSQLNELSKSLGQTVSAQKLAASPLMLLSNTTARMAGTLNQRLKGATKYAKPSGEEFAKVWQMFDGRFEKLKAVSHVGAFKNMADEDMNRIIGKLDSGIVDETKKLGSGKVSDEILSQIVTRIISSDTKLFAPIKAQAERIAVMRAPVERDESGQVKESANERVYRMLKSGDLKLNSQASVASFDIFDDSEGKTSDTILNKVRVGRTSDSQFHPKESILAVESASDKKMESEDKKRLLSHLNDILAADARKVVADWASVPSNLKEGKRPKVVAKIAPLNLGQYNAVYEKIKENKGLRKTAIDKEFVRNNILPLLTKLDKPDELEEFKFRDHTTESGVLSSKAAPTYDAEAMKSANKVNIIPSGAGAIADFNFLKDNHYFKGKNDEDARATADKFFEGVARYAKGGIVPGGTGKPKASVFDVDDTLLDLASFMPAHQERNAKLPKEQRLNWWEEVAKDPKGIPAAIQRLKDAQMRGNKILLMTARPQSYDEVTMDTLRKLGIDTNGVKLISRANKDYRKPEQMKYDKTSKYSQWYDIEEFYDDMAKTRGAVSLLGINTINPLKLAKGGMIPGYNQGSPNVQESKEDFMKKLASASKMPSQSELSKLSPGEQALVYQMFARHRTGGDFMPLEASNPKKLVHPSRVLKANMQIHGPGMYFANTPEESYNRYREFGPEVFKPSLSKEAQERVRNSKGYLDENTLKLKLEQYKDILKDRGYYESITMSEGFTAKGLVGAKYRDPFIQALIKEGYIGYRNGSVLTDWLIGTKGFGVEPAKYANGVFSVPGPKGAGDVVPAMLSPGEAVIPAKQAGRYRPMIKQMIAGNLPGYAKGGIIPGYEEGTDNVKGNFIERIANSLIAAVKKASGRMSTKDLATTTVDAEGKLLDEKEKITKMSRQQIEEEISLTDDEYKALLARQKLLKAHTVMNEEQRAEFQKNEQQILATEQNFMAQRNIQEKKESGLKKAFTRNKFTGAAQGAMYGATGLVSTASMIPGVDKFAQAALPAIGAMTGAMSMIPGPAGMVVGGLLAVATIAQQLEAHFKALRDESAKSTRALGASVESMKKLSEFSKKVGSREIMDRRRDESASSFFFIKPGKKTFGESYMESEAGKELATSTSKAVKAGDVKSAAALITSQMGTAIGQGILSPEQARSIVSNLAKQIKNTSFGIDINAKITSLFGPDGSPLEVTKNTIKLALEAVTTLSAAGGGTGNFGSEDAKAAGGAAVVESTIAAMNSIQAATDALALNPKATQKDKDELTALAQTTTQQLYDNIVAQKDNTGNMSAAAVTAVEEAYKGSGFEDVAKSVAQQIKDSSKFNDQQEIFLNNMVASKVVGTTQMQTAMNLGIDGTQLVDLLKTNPTALNQLLGIAGSMAPALGKSFIAGQAGKSSQDLAATASAIELTNKTTGVYNMDEQSQEKINMFYATEGLDKAKMIDKEFKALNAKKDITINTILGVSGDNTELKNAINAGGGQFQKYFDKFKDKKNKLIFTTQFNSLVNLGTDELAGAIKSYLSEKGRLSDMAGKSNEQIVQSFKVEYAAFEANRVTEAGALEDLTVNPADAAGSDTGGPQASILDQYVKMLREGSNYAQKLTVGWTASYNALSKYGTKAISQMAGIASLMKQYGGDAGIINDFLGGTEEEQNRIIDKTTGKLKAGAGQLIAKLKQIKDMQEFGLSYVLASPAERMAKDNELYQAGLDVIGNKEKKINDKYDKRIKALDEIGKLQDKNNQQQQDTLTLADALSKGDIAAAARAAMTAKQNNQKRALDEAKESIELARKQELEGITTKILGKTVTRADLEAKIEVNSGKIAEHKRIELNRQIEIGKNAVIAAKASADQLRTGKLIAGLPKGGGGSGTGTGGGGSGGTGGTGGTGGGGGGGGNPTAFSLKNFQSAEKAATVAGLTEAKGKAEAAVETAKTAITKKFKSVSSTELNAALSSGNYQSIYKDLKPAEQSEFVSMFKDAQSKQAVVKKYDFTPGLYGADITSSEAGQEAIAAISETIPQAIKDAARVLGQNKDDSTDGPYKKDIVDYDNARRAYIKKRDSYDATKGLAWNQITPENKSYLQKEYDAFQVQEQEVRGKLKATNDARTTLIDFLAKAKVVGKTEQVNFLNKHLGGSVWTYMFDSESLTKVDGSKDFMSWKHYAMGGMVAPKGYARGGGIYGTDTVPAMLTPGEFVIKKSAVDQIGSSKLNALNSGNVGSESVYNYSITVNANSSDASDIADAVLRQIKRVDSQRLRSNVI